MRMDLGARADSVVDARVAQAHDHKVVDKHYKSLMRQGL